MKFIQFLLAALFSASCGAASLDFGRILDAGKDVMGATRGIDEKEEIDIGRGLTGRMLGQVDLVDDKNLQAYVNRVGRWVASQSERPDLPWRFGVVNTGSVNAMAMPGGMIMITRGLYDILDNEAQLGGVLGHEIAHVVKKHHITVMQKQRLVSAGANLAASRAGGNQLRGLVLDKVKELFLSGLDKESEYEADAAGVILAARAGYSAYGLAEVLHKLNTRSSSDPSLELLFATHPAPSDRLGRLGDLLSPRADNLPAGKEPQITRVSASAGSVRTTAPMTAPGAKSLTSEDSGASSFAPAPSQPAQPAGGVGNPMDAIKGLKGLFGR